MSTIRVDLPAELVALAAHDEVQPSQAAARLIALELFREDRISLGRAAELADMALEDFMAFSASREVPLHYRLEDWTEDTRSGHDFSL